MFLTLVVKKSPTVFIFILALDYLLRENRDFLNRLKDSVYEAKFEETQYLHTI